MEEIRSLDAEFKKQLKQAIKESDEFFESVGNEKPKEYIAVKCAKSLKSQFGVQKFQLSVVRRFFEQQIKVKELQDKNSGRLDIYHATQMLQHFANLHNAVQNEMIKFTSYVDNKALAIRNPVMEQHVVFQINPLLQLLAQMNLN